MPIKPLDRLLFAQGGKCFFCERALPKAEASVEHLVALTHGGPDNDENCVACCKQLNTLFGRMSLKEKLRIVLNQEGCFACPTDTQQPQAAKKIVAPKPKAPPPSTFEEKLQAVLADLRKRGAAKPATAEKLKNTMKSALKNGESEDDLAELLSALQALQWVTVTDGAVAYALPDGTA
jgi:hypothetical protein